MTGTRLVPSNTSVFPLLQSPEETRSLPPIFPFPSSSNLNSAHGSGVTFALLKQTLRLQRERPARTHTYTYSKAAFDVNRWLGQHESHSMKHEVMLQGTNRGKSAHAWGPLESARRFMGEWGVYNENDTAKREHWALTAPLFDVMSRWDQSGLKCRKECREDGTRRHQSMRTNKDIHARSI